MKTVAVIPARYGSTRLPGKPLLDICGKPLIQRVWDVVARVHGLNEIIVATDDERIAEVVRDFGGRAVMTSPDCQSGSDRVREVAQTVEADVYVNVQGDEPLLEASAIEKLLEVFEQDADVQVADWAYTVPADKAVRLDGKWGLRFVQSAPEVAHVPDSVSLGSWPDLNFEGARTTMATACYTTTFTLDNPAAFADWELILGDVRESARVRINGVEVTTLWAVPFRCNVGKYLRPGDNTLEVEVTNLPANRISDMDKQGVKWRIFKDINIAALGYKKGDYAGWTPVPSGLLGPVELMPLKTE